MLDSRYSVWAPNAKQVELALTDQALPMTRDEHGWWRVDGPGAAVDYGFRVDGNGPWPDPRSGWQPSGVHGLSRRVDHGTFRWSDSGRQAPPLASGLVYELHVGTFSPEGTFDGAIARLDHVAGLGVTHVELMPVNQFAGSRGWGYDGVDLYAPHVAYGGPDGLKRLVDACHVRGLGVILDVVYNHFGPEGCYVSKFGPYLTNRHQTPWGPAVNLDDPESDEVRRFFIDNALMWLRDYHIDGLRIDSVHAMLDTSAVHFLEQLADEVRQLVATTSRHHFLIGESALNDPRVIQPVQAGGFSLDAQWNDDFHHALHAVLTGEQSGYYADFGPLADLARAFERAFVYDGRYSRFRRKTHGRPATGIPGWRFVVFLQDHDQVGNRAAGERITQQTNPERVKVGAALLLTSPFVPMLFQGEEWAASAPFQFFSSFENPELANAVRDGRRAEFSVFGWKPEDVPDPQSPETFERSRLNWGEIGSEQHVSMLEWYRQLIRLRRQTPGLAAGLMESARADFDEQARWFRLSRGLITVACNLSAQTQAVPLSPDRPRGLLLASRPDVRLQEAAIELPAESVAILG